MTQPASQLRCRREVLVRLSENLRERHRGLFIAGAEAPPFRPLTPEEARASTERIARSGARLVFVGLGCPKQELFAAAHADRIPAVQLCVGAAFDFLAGTKPMAPRWMQALHLRAMPLGLDLRGGLYLLYEVDIDAAVEQVVQSYEQDFRRVLREANIPFTDINVLKVDSDVNNGLRVRNVTTSPLLGPAGNREFFLHLETPA